MIVIASMPLIETNRALAAPAVLKSALAQHGMTSVALDLNAEIYVKFQNSGHKKQLLDFFYNQVIHDEVVAEINSMIEHCTKKIIKHNPTLIGLSLFAKDCQVFTAWLCASLKQIRPECVIVIGGPGIFQFDYAEKIKELGLINDYISGDGEESLIEYVRGNTTYPGINSWQWKPVTNLNTLPYPDYSDYDFYWYAEPSIPIVDSRGCVRACEFCDVIEMWNKFQYKDADSIFAEMLHQIQKHNINYFDFRSSISNGNLREFRKLLTMIADYNQSKFTSEQIGWEGSFIVRPKNNHPESMWEILQKTNATLFLGIESVIPRIRNQIGKNFANEDIDWHLAMGQKYNIKIVLLLISGYPTESLADYEATKQWFRDRKQFANNSVIKVNVSQAGIIYNTALYKNADKYNIINFHTGTNWVNKELNIAVDQRTQYHNELKNIISKECNFLI